MDSASYNFLRHDMILLHFDDGHLFDSLLALVDLFPFVIFPLQIFVLQLEHEQYGWVLIIGDQFVVTIQLVSHSSFLHKQSVTPPCLISEHGV